MAAADEEALPAKRRKARRPAAPVWRLRLCRPRGRSRRGGAGLAPTRRSRSAPADGRAADAGGGRGAVRRGPADGGGRRRRRLPDDRGSVRSAAASPGACREGLLHLWRATGRRPLADLVPPRRRRRRGAGSERRRSPTQAGPRSWRDGEVVHIDVRGLEAPRPLVAILALIDGGGHAGHVVVHHDREPLYLYPELEDRGWQYAPAAEPARARSASNCGGRDEHRHRLRRRRAHHRLLPEAIPLRFFGTAVVGHALAWAARRSRRRRGPPPPGRARAGRGRLPPAHGRRPAGDGHGRQPADAAGRPRPRRPRDRPLQRRLRPSDSRRHRPRRRLRRLLRRGHRRWRRRAGLAAPASTSPRSPPSFARAAASGWSGPTSGRGARPASASAFSSPCCSPLDYGRAILPDHRTLAVVHMTLMAYGFLGLLALGLSQILIPMFAITEPAEGRLPRGGLGLALADRPRLRGGRPSRRASRLSSAAAPRSACSPPAVTSSRRRRCWRDGCAGASAASSSSSAPRG